MSSVARTRWAAIGAAAAVAITAGGVGFVNADVTSGERTVFVPITPCRLFDTRPEFQVGPKGNPLGTNEIHSVPGVGAVGNCNIPPDALALALNVTAIDATLPTFLAVWPAGEERPVASSLNPAPGQPPTPNAVTTNLGSDNEFSIFNLQGTVNVFADAVGYYADHNHDDRYYQKAQTYTQAQVDAAISGAIDDAAVPDPWQIDIGPADFSNPSTNAYPGVNVDSWYALSFADVFGRAYYSFRLPDEYVAGTDIRVTFDWTWLPSALGAIVPPCKFVMTAERLGSARPGTPPALHGTTMDDPNESAEETDLAVTTAMFAGGPIVQSSGFAITGTFLRPGDRLAGSLVRRGADGTDTCTGGLAVFGLTITAA